MARACHPRHPVATRRSLRFDDFDEMAEHIAAWDVRYEQFSSGLFRATMVLTASPSVQILTLDWNRALSNLGAPPPGMRSFAFPTTRRHAFRFRGVAAGPGAVMTGRGGSEFHLLTAGAFDFVVASLDLGMIAGRLPPAAPPERRAARAAGRKRHPDHRGRHALRLFPLRALRRGLPAAVRRTPFHDGPPPGKLKALSCTVAAVFAEFG